VAIGFLLLAFAICGKKMSATFFQSSLRKSDSCCMTFKNEQKKANGQKLKANRSIRVVFKNLLKLQDLK
jgi:hypothetical protein